MNQGELKSKIESLLFISNRPLGKKEMARILKERVEDLEAAFLDLSQEYQDPQRGINIIEDGQSWQMITNPQNGELVKDFLQQEIDQELTPASLETLSVIAYRGPITKEELEKIRGVNCTIILRNLLIKGLVEEKKVSGEEERDQSQNLYTVSLEFIKCLGIDKVQELPDYEKLNQIENLSEDINKE
ncbi:SMC-Scp complex subunit ScpB [Patescibacteria group bacterium]|nr:SMC-Scp complex subunit ScpB [Patescibacteria group bacterium]